MQKHGSESAGDMSRCNRRSTRSDHATVVAIDQMFARYSVDDGTEARNTGVTP